ncbi:MAG TPA: TlpA disulfide reductase family protein [Nitrospira sp.]|nr:TlpA disulfide reductase family protein [Nitrospira sp.]
MRPRARGLLVPLVLAGCVILLSTGEILRHATAAVNDPFVTLRMTRLASDVPIAEFDLTALDGKTVDSKALIGKVVLLNFWATWCGPCKEEMPSLAKLQAKFDPTQFQVVTVTTDRHPKGIKQFLDHLGIHLPVLFDEQEEVSRAFMVRGLPTTVLLTQDGHAVARAVGPRAWDSEESVALVRYVLEGTK